MRKTLVNVGNQISTERTAGAALPGFFLNLTKKEVRIMKVPFHFGRRALFMSIVCLLALVCFPVFAIEAWAANIPFSKAKIIFEFNSSGPDLGIQVTLDGEPWNEIWIKDPRGRTILEVEGSGSLKNFGLTELFAESNEPNFADMSKAEILARFPEGVYKFSGTTVEGDKLVGAATLTHNIPDGPVIVSPLPSDVVDPNNTVINWNAVTTPPEINIVGYQVIVEGGSPFRTFDVNLPGTATSVTVPPEFLEPGTQYIFEVLAIEIGGNQTITEGSFSTQ